MTQPKRPRAGATQRAQPNPAPADRDGPPIDDDPPGDVLIDKVGNFTIIPNSFIEDARLSNAAVRLWIYLRKFGSGRQATTVAYPGYKRIREELGWGSDVTVNRALDELIKAGWMSRKRRGNTSSFYTLNPCSTESGEHASSTESGEQHYRKWRTRSTESGVEQHQPEQHPETPPPRRPAQANAVGGGDAGKPEPEHAETVMRELVKQGVARTPHTKRIAAKIAQHMPNLDVAAAVIANTLQNVKAGKPKNPPQGAMLTRLDAMTVDDWKAKTPRPVQFEIVPDTEEADARPPGW